MAQNGPHDHQVGAAAGTAADYGHTAPQTTVAFSSLTSAGPYGNGGSSSSAGNMEIVDPGAGMGKKNLIPDLNMEQRDSAGGITKDKPRSEAEAVEVPSADADADADKCKTVAAADDGKPNANSIALERERRKRMKGLFRELQDLMPHVPQKSDKVTILGEVIKYIKFLEEEAAKLKEMLQQALAQQAADRVEASSSSFPFTAMPQTAQGMAALCSLDAAQRADWGGVPVPPAAPAMPALPVRFKTWSGQNMVLTVAKDNAYISVCVPRRPNTLTLVTSVLDNHGIDMITAHISANSVRALFMIYAHVARTNGANRSSEEVYQRAVSEIMYRLHSNNN